MRRILGKFVFQVYSDRSLGEIISRLAEIDAMDTVEMTMAEFTDLDLEHEALEEAIERLIALNTGHTLH